MNTTLFNPQNASPSRTSEKIKKVSVFYRIIIFIVSILSLIFLALINPLSAATYYYISGPINALSSWKTGDDGTGTSPTSFTSGSNTFVIWNSLSSVISPTLSGVWNFGGSNILQIGTSTAGSSKKNYEDNKLNFITNL